MVRFTTKKIDSLTLGERMKKIRDERRLSLAEISKSTKIQVKYLEYLEEGEYLKLPADVYVRGFLRSYAIFMGLNETALFKQYEREKGIHKNIKKIADCDTRSNPINFSSLVITPKMIIIGMVLFLVVSSFVYLYAQVNNFVSAPRLVIMKPADGSLTEGTSTHVTGVAEKDALVFINDQKVLVNENGEFSEDVGLRPGQNMITVKARSKFDKEASQSVSVNANFQNSANEAIEGSPEGIENIQQESKPFFAEIYVSPNPTWLSIEVDGEVKYSGVLDPKLRQTFNADRNISVTSTNGNETFVKINGKDLGKLGENPAITKDVIYDANGKVENI
ncbi:MAG: Transcriptional regulator, XRE family [Candidatus Moranbacteria bacterium GW2011_GWC2_37_8]|nr:MAG: Transcriptional regulator, XRE family [Candidatus Moranbacteria bacterium GW2011_GWC2_37_8]KKQ61358.1 MAG: Transcriptional regulator, XRE family [Parcubacteria group bacterium GW2011_GWC1_38_22]KKQ79406.1 MAG: Transcriptional regulator, XRE family [Candidatus Moranbacteria bacterium GW2011_GWD2_38_7]